MEGRQTEGDETARPAGKVVRLPRDWLGPREQLVPFGPAATPPEAEAELSDAGLMPGAPPSAADFWGERSAAIHDALQAPAEDTIDVAATAGGTAAVPRRARRRIVASAAAAVAVAAAASLLWIGFGLRQPSTHDAGGANVNMAAVVSGGVPRMLERGIALLDASAGGAGPRLADRHHARSRRIPHPRPVLKPLHEAARSHLSPPANPAPAASVDAARTTPAPSVNTYRTVSASSSVGTAPPTHHTSSAGGARSASSRATVSPTGESGALGPINSPNG